jgi:hypothetical protein
VRWSFAISPYHDRELPPSTTYTEYSIHQVPLTLTTACTAYSIIPKLTLFCSQPVSHLSAEHVVFNSLHLHNYESPNDESLCSHGTSIPNYRSRLTESESPPSRLIITSKCISELTRPRPPTLHHLTLWSAFQNALEYDLGVCLTTLSIMASEWVSQQAQLRPPCSHDHGLQMHLQTQLIAISECIS